MPDLINYKMVFKAISKIFSYQTDSINNLLGFILNELVVLTQSQIGYAFIYSAKEQTFTLAADSGLINFNKPFKRGQLVLRFSEAGPWAEALTNKKEILINRECQLYNSDFETLSGNVVERLLSLPLELDNYDNIILVISDKGSDYSDDDLSMLKLIKGCLVKTIENIKVIGDLTNLKVREAEQARIKNSYINYLSHEIKTPINAINGFTQLLKEENLSLENRHKFNDIVLESSKDLVVLINSISELSNIETGNVRIVEQEVNLVKLFNELEKQFREEAIMKKLQFQFETNITEDEAAIISDREKIIRIISVMLSNSFRSTFTGKIIFGFNKKEEFIEFFVSDTGTGISDLIKKKLFNSFSDSGESIVKSFEGAGFGLLISKAYIERLGGKIWFNTVEGKGSDFYFTVPYKKTSILSETKSMPEYSTHNPKNRKKAILVAEDDHMNFSLIKIFLSELDIILTRAENGRDAVELFKDNHFDIVLMDIRMPEMDGYTATRLIKEINPKQVVIAQTAYTNDREIALANGCTDFIAKPFFKDQFLSLVNNYI